VTDVPPLPTRESSEMRLGTQCKGYRARRMSERRVGQARVGGQTRRAGWLRRSARAVASAGAIEVAATQLLEGPAGCASGAVRYKSAAVARGADRRTRGVALVEGRCAAVGLNVLSHRGGVVGLARVEDTAGRVKDCRYSLA
jgi:hypothetical protein